MEASGLVHREVYAKVPPRVEYSLTELGSDLKPIHEAMWIWGEKYKKTSTCAIGNLSSHICRHRKKVRRIRSHYSYLHDGQSYVEMV